MHDEDGINAQKLCYFSYCIPLHHWQQQHTRRPVTLVPDKPSRRQFHLQPHNQQITETLIAVKGDPAHA